MAKELLELYARRAARADIAFSPDTEPWQQELEGAFPFELTPDQHTCGSPRSRTTWSRRAPMDRLLVGDVGFGKTEVGVRAAFKAVMDGQPGRPADTDDRAGLQHLETFSERFAPFPSASR